jgi:hypothetical protein
METMATPGINLCLYMAIRQPGATRARHSRTFVYHDSDRIVYFPIGRPDTKPHLRLYHPKNRQVRAFTARQAHRLKNMGCQPLVPRQGGRTE